MIIMGNMKRMDSFGKSETPQSPPQQPVTVNSDGSCRKKLGCLTKISVLS